MLAVVANVPTATTCIHKLLHIKEVHMHQHANSAYAGDMGTI